jgi:lipopolysaccharide/colanic/teichoic acid biosynthesis glycosyltransferase
MPAQLVAQPGDGSTDRSVAGVETPAPSPGYLRFKAASDILLAVILLVVLAPLIAILMVLVKLTSPGPAIYSQVRLGRDGRRFRIHKLRSMTHECERDSGPRWSIGNDPRVTRLGRLLRRTHLDELPQLWNVVRGEMSLVGPRPERPEFVEQLERAIPGYRGRLVVRPGVTGLAQVQLPADTDLDSVRRKIGRDLHYIEEMGPRLDLKILVATAMKVVGVPCPTACRLLGIPTREVDRDEPAAPWAAPHPADRQLVAEPA